MQEFIRLINSEAIFYFQPNQVNIIQDGDGKTAILTQSGHAYKGDAELVQIDLDNILRKPHVKEYETI